MQLFYQPEIQSKVYNLDKSESIHCIQVLRKRVGDEITVIDGNGAFYDVIISRIEEGICYFEIQRRRPQLPDHFQIHIAVAPTKSIDRLEWMVEKLVEIGVDKISFLLCKHSERKSINIDRLTRKAIAALKQSGKAKLPSIFPMYDYNEFIELFRSEENKFIAYMEANPPVHLLEYVKKAKNYLVLIGPEGDFSSEEVELASQANYIQISLGNSRLRTETAAIASCHTIHLANN